MRAALVFRQLALELVECRGDMEETDAPQGVVVSMF